MRTEPKLSAMQEGAWPGLAVWRAKGIDDRRGWGKKGSCSSVAAPGWELYEHVPLAPSLVDCGLQVGHVTR